MRLLSLIFCAVAWRAWGESTREVRESGWCGDDVRWTYDQDSHTLFISGKGDMKVFGEQSSPWFGIKDQIEHGEIGNGVTSIGDYSFYNCTALRSVLIPRSVTSIGTFAFELCKGLTVVAIPNSVVSIGDAAFSYSGLKTLTIPPSVHTIGFFVFSNCYSLTSVTILPGLTLIERGAFQFCTNLTSVTIPSTVVNISEDAFAHCSNLSSITIPSSVSFIGDSAFSCCDLLTEVCSEVTKEPKCSNSSFPSGNKISIYVPEYYSGTQFCGNTIHGDLIGSDQNDHCYTTLVDITRKGPDRLHFRTNASMFESKTDGCTRYECLNASGGKTWHLCNNSDGKNLICINGECLIKNEAINETGWRVEIELKRTNSIEFDAEEIETAIIETTGVDETITIGVERNEKGEMVRVVVFVNDEKNARLIKERVNKCVPLSLT